MTERERIMQVMTQKGLTSSQFAESIGIQRAAMSHITSGRNNPSLDVMKKILERFPDISADWLLMEKGPMTRGTQPTAAPPEAKAPAPSLFTPPHILAATPRTTPQPYARGARATENHRPRGRPHPTLLLRRHV